MQPKLKNKYEEYREKEGHTQIGESLTNQSQAEDADINKCIEKYGIQSLIAQTMASEPLYLDNTNRNMTLDEAVRQRQQMDEYFAKLPAKARKQFGDSSEIFYQKYKTGEFDDMLTYGILSKEQIMAIGGLNEKDLQNIIDTESVSTDSN